MHVYVTSNTKHRFFNEKIRKIVYGTNTQFLCMCVCKRAHAQTEQGTHVLLIMSRSLIVLSYADFSTNENFIYSCQLKTHLIYRVSDGQFY